MRKDWGWIANKWQDFGGPKHNSRHILSLSFKENWIFGISTKDLNVFGVLLFEELFFDFGIIYNGNSKLFSIDSWNNRNKKKNPKINFVFM